MRDISEVIDSMISKVPDRNSKIVTFLEKIKQDASYTPPEAMYIRWSEISTILQSEINSPAENWHYEVLSIFSMKPFEEIKNFYEGRKK